MPKTREEKRAYRHRWYVAHKTESNEKSAAWFKAHPGYQKKYLAANPEKYEKRLAATRAWKKQHPESLREWRKKHPNYDDRYKTSAHKKPRVKKTREEKNKFAVAWYAKNKDKVKASRKVYILTHRAELRKRLQNWRKKNPEKSHAITRAWHLKNRDHVCAMRRAYYARNKVRINTYKNAWYQDHLEQARAAKLRGSAKYNAAKRGNGGSYTEADWKLIIRVMGNRCAHPDKKACCGVIQRDHIKPISRGGANIFTNLQPLCAHHNTSKRTNYIDYRTPEQIKQIENHLVRCT